MQVTLRSRRHGVGFPVGLRGRGRRRRSFDDEFSRIQPNGTGRVEQFRCEEPQFGPPHRSVDDEYEPAPVEVGQSRMRGQRRGQVRTQPLVQFFEPEGTSDRTARGLGQQRIQRGLRS